MPWSTPIPVYLSLLIVLLAGLLLWFRQPRSILATLVLWVDFLAAGLILFFIVNWSIVNYYLRYLCLVVPGAVLLRYLLKLRWNRPTFLPAQSARGPLAALIIGALLLPPLGWANLRVQASSRLPTQESVPLLVLVPFYGMWVVTNGGNALEGVGMSNYANPLFPPDNPTDPSMAYGVDFQEITIRGALSFQGSRPADFREYEGFNTEIFAPCSGQVVFVDSANSEVEVDTPLEQIASQGLGNRVVIQCFEVFVTVANLRGILVQEGQQVDVGQTIGYLGNNRQPSIPHLHVHASRGSYGPDGIPVPLLFEYDFATRNRVFIR